MSLLRRAGTRHLARHPLQLVLTVVGVALGVAVVVAMDLAIQSSREAFRVSSGAVTGAATHQLLGGPSGVPDSLPALLRIEAGVRALAPVVEGYVVSPTLPDRPLRLLGVDLFAEAPFRPHLAGGPAAEVDGRLLLTTPGGVLVSRGTAESLGVAEGDRFPVGQGRSAAEMVVVGVLDPADELSRRGLAGLLVVDIAEAQELLGAVGRLDRVDIILSGGEAEARQRARIEALLPPDVRLETAGARERAMEGMMRAFDLNLTALSLLALLFGLFLIYNTMTFSVVQRRGMFGTMRALGATRGEILGAVLRESAVLGVVGSAIGLLFGIVLGRGLVRLVTRTINDLYFTVSVEGLALPPEVLLKGAVVGVGATILAGLPPAWEATQVSPREALARVEVEDRVRRHVPVLSAAGAAAAFVGVLLLLLPTAAIVPAFAGLFAILLGMALLVPGATILLLAVLRRPIRRVGGVIGGMAARGVVTALSRTAPAMAALVIAVAVTVGLGVMIQSFRGSVVQWLDVTLQADLYVSSPSPVSSRQGGTLPPHLLDAARALPGVAGVSSYRGVEFLSGYGMTRVVGLDLHPRGEAGLDLLASRDGDVLAAFRAGEGALVSEPFAFRHRLGVGDEVRLPGEAGEASFPVLGVYRDYGTELGTIMLGRLAFDRLWDDDGITSLGIFLEGGADPGEVEGAVRREAGADALLQVRENRILRELTLEVFDRTFAVTRVLRLLAFVVAFIGVFAALMALQLERGRELAVLRAGGMTPGQVWGLVTAQTGIMGTLAGLFALPVGWVLAVVMIQVVNRRSFGWTLSMELEFGLLAQGVLLALVGALLAGVYPSWRMSRTRPAAALRGE